MKQRREKSFSLVAFIFLLSSITITAAAQLDSLPRLLSKTEQDIANEECALTCQSISLTYARKDMPLPALEWIERAIALSSDSAVVSKSYRIKGQLLSKLQRFSDILEATQSSKRFGNTRIPQSELAILFNLEGSTYAYTGRYEEAFRQFYNSLLISSQNNNRDGIFTSTLNLALVYYKVRDYHMAIEYWHKAMELTPERDYDYALLLSNLALGYIHANRPEDALSFLRDIANTKATIYRLDSVQIPYAYGVINHTLQQFDSALVYYSTSLELALKHDHSRYAAENYLVIAQIKISRSDTTEVSKYLARAEEYATENKYEDIIVKIYEQQMKLAEQLRANSQELVGLQSKFIQKKIELYNTNLSQLLARRKSEYFEREFRVALKRQDYLLQANQESERAQNIFNYIFCCLFALIGALLVLVFVSIRTRKRHRLNLEIVVINRSHFVTKRVEELGSFVAQFHSSVYSARRVLIRAIDHRSIRVRQKIHARNTL